MWDEPALEEAWAVGLVPARRVRYAGRHEGFRQDWGLAADSFAGLRGRGGMGSGAVCVGYADAGMGGGGVTGSDPCGRRRRGKAGGGLAGAEAGFFSGARWARVVCTGWRGCGGAAGAFGFADQLAVGRWRCQRFEPHGGDSCGALQGWLVDGGTKVCGAGARRAGENQGGERAEGEGVCGERHGAAVGGELQSSSDGGGDGQLWHTADV